VVYTRLRWGRTLRAWSPACVHCMNMNGCDGSISVSCRPSDATT
jgi:hypothetical protein